MRQAIILTFLSLTIFICGNGQNVRLSNQTVSNERSRTIYLGIENKFLVTDSLVTGMEQHANASLSENRLVIRPTTPGYITLTFLKGQDKAQVIFYAKNIPQASLALGNQKGNKVRKDSLIANPWIGVAPDPNDGFYQGYVVESCKVMIAGEEFSSAGNFSDPLKNAIRTTKSGDQLVITEIKLFNEKLKKTVSGGTYKFTIE